MFIRIIVLTQKNPSYKIILKKKMDPILGSWLRGNSAMYLVLTKAFEGFGLGNIAKHDLRKSPITFYTAAVLANAVHCTGVTHLR